MSFTPARRDLWLVILAKSASLLGDEVAAVALMLRLQSHGAPPSAIAALLIAAMLPLLLLAGVVGRLVDRVDSRMLLVVSSLTQGALCVLLAYTTDTAAVLALVAALGAGQAVNGATWQALLPAIVGTERLPQAIGMTQAATTIASIVAPALSGILTGLFGARVPLLLDAATFLAITAAGLMITTRHGTATATTTGTKAGGLRIVRTDPLLLMLFGLLAVFITLGAMVNVVEVFLVRDTLHASTVWYGLVGAVFGLGALTGSLLGGRLRGDIALARAFTWSAAGLAAGLAGIAAVPSVAWLLPLVFAAGAANGVLNLALGALVMGRSPAQARGRVGAVLNGVASATQLGAYALGGLLASVLSPRETFAVAGLSGLLAPVLFGRRLVRAAGLPALLDRDDVDRADVGVLGEQVRPDLSESLGNLPVEVRLPGVLGLEGVEDAVGDVVDLEGIPGHGSGFARG
jgi:MFS family permease